MCLNFFCIWKTGWKRKHQPIDRLNIICVLYKTVYSINATFYAINSTLPPDYKRVKSDVLLHFSEHSLIYCRSFFCFISAGKYHPSRIEINTIVFWQVYLPLDFLLSETSCVLRSYQHALKYHFNHYFFLTLLTKFLRHKRAEKGMYIFYYCSVM